MTLLDGALTRGGAASSPGPAAGVSAPSSGVSVGGEPQRAARLSTLLEEREGEAAAGYKGMSPKRAGRPEPGDAETGFPSGSLVVKAEEGGSVAA